MSISVHVHGTSSMPACYDAEVEGFAAFYEDAEDHGLEDHLITMMEQWNGIGDFLEDFIEQALLKELVFRYNGIQSR